MAVLSSDGSPNSPIGPLDHDGGLPPSTAKDLLGARLIPLGIENA